MFESLVRFLRVMLKSLLKVPNDDISEVILPDASKKEVKIDINKQIRNKYKKGWINKVRKKPITEIVLHGTAGGSTAKGLLQWMYNGARAREYNRGIALFHYAIDRSGKIVEVIDPDYWVYHSSSGRHDKVTIGIELMNPSKGNTIKYTTEQYTALYQLMFDYLIPLFPTIDRIVSHNFNQKYYSGYGKQCPGPAFSWASIKTEMAKRKMKNTYNKEVFVIKKQ